MSTPRMKRLKGLVARNDGPRCRWEPDVGDHGVAVGVSPPCRAAVAPQSLLRRLSRMNDTGGARRPALRLWWGEAAEMNLPAGARISIARSNLRVSRMYYIARAPMAGPIPSTVAAQ